MSNIINLTSFGLVWDTQDHMWEDLQSNYRKLLQHIVSQKYKKRQKVKIASSHVVYLYKNSEQKSIPTRTVIEKIFTVGYLFRVWRKLFDIYVSLTNETFSEFPLNNKIKLSVQS